MNSFKHEVKDFLMYGQWAEYVAKCLIQIAFFLLSSLKGLLDMVACRVLGLWAHILKWSLTSDMPNIPNDLPL